MIEYFSEEKGQGLGTAALKTCDLGGALIVNLKSEVIQKAYKNSRRGE